MISEIQAVTWTPTTRLEHRYGEYDLEGAVQAAISLPGVYWDAWNAYAHDDLNAAKSLHDALLPGGIGA